jgi:hypothetical protein
MHGRKVLCVARLHGPSMLLKQPLVTLQQQQQQQQQPTL